MSDQLGQGHVGAANAQAPEVDLAELRQEDGDTLSDALGHRVRTSIPWARKYTPGHPNSHVQINSDVVKAVHLPFDPQRHQWFSRYELHKRNPELPKEFHQGSKQQRCGTSSEHQAFQTVLKWMWGKHAAVAPGSAPPPWVALALEDCAHCGGNLHCDAMQKLSGSKDTHPKTTRIVTPTGAAFQNPDATGISQTPASMATDLAQWTNHGSQPVDMQLPGNTSMAKWHAQQTFLPEETRPSTPPQAPLPPPAPPPEEVTTHGTAPSRDGEAEHLPYMCPLCAEWTTHVAAACPLSMAAWPAVSAEQSARPWCRVLSELPRVQLPDAKIIVILGDGNCMFASYLAAVEHCARSTNGTRDATDNLTREALDKHGRNTRFQFLQRVEKLLNAPVHKTFGGIPVYSILLDVHNLDASSRALQAHGQRPKSTCG